VSCGRPVETAEIVISLHTFIREVFDLEPVPATLSFPGRARCGPLAAPVVELILNCAYTALSAIS
jgi:hypothetical protein